MPKPGSLVLAGVLFLVGAAFPSADGARAEDYAGPAVIGEMGSHVAEYEDTLVKLARRFDLGFVELRAANPGVDAWLPGEGTRIVLPKAHVLPTVPRRGIVINLADQRLYFFRDDGAVFSFPVGIGREEWETPELETRVVGKRTEPVWSPPASIRAERPDLPAAVPPGPENPLGNYAIDLAHGDYVIHGTNKPLGVGRRVSHGCIRLYPEDIAVLFPMVPPGTPVRIVDQAAKLGWSEGTLYLEVHPTQDQADAIEAGRDPAPAETPPGLMAAISGVAGDAVDRLDWSAIRRAVRERRGVPVPVTGPAAATSAR